MRGNSFQLKPPVKVGTPIPLDRLEFVGQRKKKATPRVPGLFGDNRGYALFGFLKVDFYAFLA